MLLIVNFAPARTKVCVVYLDNGEIWELRGECKRCGSCCETFKVSFDLLADEEGKCKYLEYEMVNDKRLAKCPFQWDKPLSCALYPRDPYDPLHPNCGFHWVKK